MISKKALGNNTSSVKGSVVVPFHHLQSIYHFTTIVCIVHSDEYRHSALLHANLSQLSNKYIVCFFQCTLNFVPVSGWKESVKLWVLS